MASADETTSDEPNGGELYGSAPVPAPRPARTSQQRNLALIAAIFVLVGSAFVGFGARDGWFTRDASSTSSSATGAGVVPSASERASANDDSLSSVVDLEAVADEVQPAIVNITSVTNFGVGAGTGMLISGKGLVLTNHHVISGATDLEVEVGGDGDTYDAHVVGYAIDDDVALVQIEDISGALPTIDTETDVVADDPVVVLGNAQGRGGEPTAASGRIVALGRQITATDETGANAETLTGMIQIAASVQPGQSGGAVVNADGEVVGMTTAASTSGGVRFGFEGGTVREAYAIPISRALAVAEEIKGGESTESVHVGPRAILGVEIQSRLVGPGGRRSPFDDDTATSDGVAVSGVDADGPAAGAGLSTGSTIMAIGDTSVRTADDITLAMNRLQPGDEIDVTWVDAQGKQHTATIELAEGPPL